MEIMGMKQFLGAHYDDVVQASLLSRGSTLRLQNALQKCGGGVPIRICYLGGSISAPRFEGCNFTVSYTELTTAAMEATFGPTVSLNAGLCGTSPVIGYHQALLQCLPDPPDIVVLEFAVNGFQTPENVLCYEAMVHDLLEAGCAVISVFTAMFKNGGLTGGQHAYSKVSARYGIPMVSIMDALRCAMEQYEMPWSLYSLDWIHASDNGQQLISDCLMHFLRTANAEPSAPWPEMPDAPYQNGILLYNRNMLPPACSFVPAETIPPFCRGWNHTPGSNIPFTFSCTCRYLFVLYQLSPEMDFGAAEVRIDGESRAVLEGYSVTSWNNTFSEVLLMERESRPHTISIAMLSCDARKKFTLLAFGMK